MNNEVNKEIEEWFLDLEDSTLDKIKKTYNKSLKDVQAKAKELQDEIEKLKSKASADDEVLQSQIRSKVYQLEYQKNLEKQISNLMDVANDKNYKTIRAYLYNVYHDGFLTEQYRLMSNGLNITMPINQKLLVKAVNTTFDDIPLSARIYENVNKAKQSIISEISRGLSTGMSNQDMARNLQNSMGVSMRKAFQIAQNEGARVRQSAIKDSMVEAKKKGADIVKQWSATLDGRTRPVHRELDGQWAEIDKKFKYSGGEVNAPKEFGIASEDVNCRCTLLSVPRWDITGKHWQLDNKVKQLVEVKNYQDWYNKYYVDTLPSQVANSQIVKNIKLDVSNYSSAFTSKNAEKQITEKFVDYINQLPNVDQNVLNLYNSIGKLDTFQENGIGFKISHASSHSVSYSYKLLSGEIGEVRLTIPKLTGDDITGQVGVTLHEEMHLIDLMLKDNLKYVGEYFSFSNQSLVDVINNTTASMSKDVESLFKSFNSKCEAIDETLGEKYRNTERALKQQYGISGNYTYASYTAYKKERNKAWTKIMVEEREYEHRNIDGGCIDMLEDIYDALANGKYRDQRIVRYGHGSNYYKTKSNKTEEIVANYGALSVLRPDLVDMLKQDKPSLVEELENLIVEMNKKV